MYNFLPSSTLPLAISEITSELDLKSLGACGKGASRVWVTGAGLVWLVGTDDRGMHLPLAANVTDQALQQEWKELAFGNVAQVVGSGGSYPVVLGSAEDLVLRLDEGTIKDVGPVTVSFPADSYTLAEVIEAINTALSTAIGKSVELATNESGQLGIQGRAHGTAAAVEIVSIGATLATALGLSAGTTNGNTTGAATGTVIIDW